MLDLANFDFKGHFEKKLTENANTDTTLWKIAKDKPGTYIFRFLPDQTGEGYVNKGFHYIPLKDGSFFKTSCRKDINQTCPLCNYGWDRYQNHGGKNSDFKKWICNQKTVSNVLIIKDPINPDNEGKVLKFEYPKTVLDKIKERISPSEASLQDPDFKAFIPFNPLESADFKMVITIKAGDGGNKYPDYAASTFRDNVGPVHKDIEQVKKYVSETIDLKEYISKLSYATPGTIVKQFDNLFDENGVPTGNTQAEQTQTNVQDQPVSQPIQTKPNVNEEINDSVVEAYLNDI